MAIDQDLHSHILSVIEDILNGAEFKGNRELGGAFLKYPNGDIQNLGFPCTEAIVSIAQKISRTDLRSDKQAEQDRFDNQFDEEYR